jgi:hypothetical protein
MHGPAGFPGALLDLFRGLTGGGWNETHFLLPPGDTHRPSAANSTASGFRRGLRLNRRDGVGDRLRWPRDLNPKQEKVVTRDRFGFPEG